MNVNLLLCAIAVYLTIDKSCMTPQSAMVCFIITSIVIVCVIKFNILLVYNTMQEFIQT